MRQCRVDTPLHFARQCENKRSERRKFRQWHCHPSAQRYGRGEAHFARHDNRRARRCSSAEEAQKLVADTACRGDFGTAGERRFVRSVEVTAKNQGFKIVGVGQVLTKSAFAR
jgi:hypothetical protein